MNVDIDLLPITRGQPLAGTWAGEPPRRADRRRSDERLVVFLTLESTTPLAADQVDPLAERLAALYYRSSGSATSAMRAVAEKLNQYLLQRNLKHSGQGQHLVGHLVLLVYRRERLVLGMSGSGHVFLAGRQRTTHFHDPDVAGRGLGISRATPIRFFQAEVRPNDLVLVAPYPPTTWHTAVQRMSHNPLAARRRLLEEAPPNACALLLHFQPGKGRVRWLDAETAPSETAPPPEPPKAVVEEREEPAAQPPPQPSVASAAQAKAPARETAPQASPAPPKAEAPPPERPQRTSWRQRLGPPLLALGSTLRRAATTLGHALGALLVRALPGDIGRLPSTVMAGMAIAVPLMVATIAAVVYFDRGRAQQYQVYFQEAQALASKAPALDDPMMERTAWEATLQKLDRAESYRQTPESRALRQQAQEALDTMNRATRLQFEPVIVGALPGGAQPKRLVVTSEDLFVLDASRGAVWHYTRSGAMKYTNDPDFTCRPGNYAGRIVSDLVDIAPLPPDNEAGALLLAVDREGNLVYCGGERGAMTRPLAPPTVPLGTVTAITYLQGDLFVLDNVGNGVYRYPGRKGMFDALPLLVFDEQVPDLRQATDLAVSPDDLFILYQDGHMVTCTLAKTDAQQTRCNDPAHYQDTRLGVSSDVLLDDALVSQMQYVPPPDPSLYLLDTAHGAVMHFSLRLTFQEQFQAADAPLTGITTFAVGPEGLIFVATTEQVYAAARP